VDEHALALLEFPRVVEALAGLCASPQGSTLLASQPILADPGELRAAHGLAVGFRAVLESGEPLPSLDFPDLDEVLPRLGKAGLLLDGEELAAVGRFVLSALALRRHVLKLSRDPGLSALAEAIPDLAELPRAVFRVVDTDGSLRERQLPELAAIRERIRRGREEVERSVRSLLDDQASRGWWQATLPTQRDGRFVLPLKAQFRGRVKGIVHELSASGSTVFIEPLEIVDKNNAVVQEEGLYRQEMRRILRELTAAVSARAEPLRMLVAGTARLDTLAARARYAIEHRCWLAEQAPGVVNLREARHPLLGQSVVPVSITAGGGDRILVITGPNTGGKTVSLKTVGLLALMNQFGMEIPAGEGSSLPVFDSVRADIGDEQSIEQSLSTFSAHVKNLADIVSGVSSRSLVLLDELGAGTDPQEGVALAMALLDRFLETGCIVLATTHHGILKNYGATRPGVQNASMGFDSESLAPTYRILMGVAGESHALEIARRTGMPREVLESAEAYLQDERTDISRLVASLSQRHLRLAEAEEEHKARETALREKWRKTDLKELTLRQKELELRRSGLKDLRDFLEAARREWDGLRESRAGDPDAGREFGRLASAIRDRIGREQERVASDQEALLPAPGFEIREGMEVLVRRSGRRGRVLRRDKGSRWLVETETLRLSLLPGELAPAGEAAEGQRSPAPVSYTTSAQVDPPVLELHLLGMRAEEALRALERQVDSALVFGLRQFSVVHGKGEGILRTVIHEKLRELPVVADFRFSAPEEGGHGKTIVTLRS
jgi:DNA mismatch repair protein MutS2